MLAAREPSHLGMFGKAKLIQVLRKVLGNVTFEQLSRKFAVVAVDLEAETEVILDTGDVVEALLATSAFPGLFAPERRDGRYLIDGGALNNVPFDVARHLGADYVIASNVSSHRGPLFHDPPLTGGPAQSFVRQLLLRSGTATLWEVVERTVSVMQDQGTEGQVGRVSAGCNAVSRGRPRDLVRRAPARLLPGGWSGCRVRSRRPNWFACATKRHVRLCRK